MRKRLRILAVSPHFAPVNAPDQQRLRMCLPYMAELGIDMQVLAFTPESVVGQPIDPFLAQQLPDWVPVTRVSAISARLTAPLGIGNVALRGLGALHLAGGKLIRTGNFDLAFFTSTQFACYPLALLWKRLYNLPYILDFQDPWINRYYLRKGAPNPPGGWKFHVIRRANALFERPTVAGAAGIMRTSAGYRFPGRRGPVVTIPFGAPEADFDAVRGGLSPAKQSSGNGVVWVAVGRGGSDMARGLTTFFHGLAEARRMQPDRFRNLRIRFLGTSYAPRGKGIETVRPLAVKAGVGDLVEEVTDRIGYRESIENLVTADAILLPCSDDLRYNPSKLAGLVLAKKPILALGDSAGPLAQQIDAWNVGRVLDWGASPGAAAAACIALLDAPILNVGADTFAPVTAAAMARRMATFFRAVAGGASR